MENRPVSFELSRQQLETELTRVRKKHGRGMKLKRTGIVVVLLCLGAARISAIRYPVRLLDNGQAVLTSQTENIAHGDLVVFSRDNALFSGRIVGLAGDCIEFDATNGVGGESRKEVSADPLQVPDHAVFVMDSEQKDGGIILQTMIVGKVILRIWPLQQLEYFGS